jgi:hypothetical protein
MSLLIAFLRLICTISTAAATVILTRRAAALRKSSGNDRYRSRSEISRPPLIELIKISATRPIVLLCTELLVALFSLWIG